MTPVRGTRPYVGLMPVVPHSADGTRMEPPVSVPRASGTIRAASADPDPVDDPPVHRSASQGFRTAP